jgi:hypothetical protein
MNLYPVNECECPLIYDVTLVASSSKWLNITAIIQNDKFKLHSLVNVMKHCKKRELISTVFRVNRFITSVS